MKKNDINADVEILRQKAEELLKKKSEAEILELIEELAYQNEEKTKRADVLSVAVACSLKLTDELEEHQVELKTLNEELIASQSVAVSAAEKYFELYNFAPTGYLTLSNHGKIDEINLSAAKILGKERLLLQGAKFGFFVSNDTKPVFNHFFEKIIADKAEESCEVTLSGTGSSLIYVHLTAIMNKNGEQCFLTMLDITADRLQQEKLKQSEQRYQALVEWSPYAALVHRDMKIVYVNPAAVKLFGATSEQDLMGTPVMRWLHPDYHQIVQERIRRAVEEGLAAPMIESKYFKCNGTVMDLEVQGMPIIYDGLPAILATFIDVTERRRSEHQLGERLKEIQTLYFLSQLSERNDLSLDSLCQELIDILPNGLQYPKIACSRMVIDGVEFCSVNFEDFPWKLTAPLLVNHLVKGWIEVAYLREMPREDEGPFLKWERDLINDVAQRLGKIIEQKKAEEERARQSALIDSLLDSIPDIIFFKDMEGVYLGCNTPFAKFAGKPINEIVGKTDYDLFDKEVADFFRHHDNEMLIQKLSRHNEEWVTYPDGRKILLDTVKTPYWAGDGSLIGILGISRDISEKKKAEKELIQLSARLTLATQAGGVGVWDYDLVNNILLWDDHMFALYGIKKEDFSGVYEAWQAGLHPDDAERGDAEIQMAIRGEKGFDTEFRLVWPDGSIHAIRALATVHHDNSGNPVSMIGTNWDITTQKSTELKIKIQNEELQKINSEKDKFFSILAHDLRSPVSSFIQTLEMLTAKRIIDESMRHEYLEGLKKISVITMNLLDNLLNWSRCQTNTMVINPVNFMINHLIKDTAALFITTAGHKSINLIIQLPEELHVFADKDAISIVIRNLISNAVKFTKPGGAITVSAYSKGDQVVVEVADTGIGMSREVLGNILQPDCFYSSYGTMNEKGCGIGLHLCREFVEKNGGEIQIQSTPGTGSLLSFNIQRGIAGLEPVLLSRDELSIEHGSLSGKRILVVDDELFNQHYIQMLFLDWEVEGVFADNGSQAVEQLKVQTFDLVLMDIEMPVMDGFSAMEIIRGSLGFTLPVIAISALTGPDFEKKVWESGMNDILIKPINPGYLFAGLMKAFGIIPSATPEKKGIANERKPSVRSARLGKLKEIFGEDPVKLSFMIGKFFESTPGSYNNILEGFAKKDLLMVRRASHKIKSPIDLFANRKMIDTIISINLLSADEANYKKLAPYIRSFRKQYAKLCLELKEELSKLQ